MISNSKKTGTAYSLLPNESCADLDYRYGPFETKEAAINYQDNEIGERIIGLKQGVKSGDTVVEYWFNGGTADVNFVAVSAGDGSVNGDGIGEIQVDGVPLTPIDGVVNITTKKYTVSSMSVTKSTSKMTLTMAQTNGNATAPSVDIPCANYNSTYPSDTSKTYAGLLSSSDKELLDTLRERAVLVSSEEPSVVEDVTGTYTVDLSGIQTQIDNLTSALNAAVARIAKLEAYNPNGVVIGVSN